MKIRTPVLFLFSSLLLTACLTSTSTQPSSQSSQSGSAAPQSPSSGGASSSAGSSGASRQGSQQDAESGSDDSASRDGSEAGGESSATEQASQAGEEEMEVLDEALDSMGADSQAVQPKEEEDFSEDSSEAQTSSEAIEAGGSSASRPSSSQPSASQPTMEELDKTLDEGFSTFDSTILREREYVRRKGREAAAQRSEEGIGEPEPELEDVLSETNAMPAPPPSGAGQEGSGEQGAPPAGGGQQNKEGEYAASGGAIPKDIPDGSDDDIVARQIREAAMKEKDPKLREKLWDEYRKYKEGQS